MKTLHEVAEEICPYRLEDYDPAIPGADRGNSRF